MGSNKRGGVPKLDHYGEKQAGQTKPSAILVARRARQNNS
jgi:hypothetical protein